MSPPGQHINVLELTSVVGTIFQPGTTGCPLIDVKSSESEARDIESSESKAKS